MSKSKEDGFFIDKIKIQYSSLIIALQLRGCIFKCLFKSTVTDSTMRENIIPEAHSFLSNSRI